MRYLIKWLTALWVLFATAALPALVVLNNPQPPYVILCLYLICGAWVAVSIVTNEPK